MSMRRRIALTTALAALIGGLAAALVALGLVRTSYDGTAREVLHREALLVAQTEVVRPAVRKSLRQLGVEIVRVQPGGRAVGTAAVDARDLATAQAGGSSTAVRRLGGVRYLVVVQPVDSGGGVVLQQKLAEARAVTGHVVRRLLLALLVGLGTAVLIGVGLARRLSLPLTRAAGAAHRLAAGDRSVRLTEDGPTEVVELSRSLNALAQALASSEARERDFLLSISHELRTPLTGIRGFAEALSDGVAPPDEAGRTILAESVRLQRLVGDLLELARARADDFVVTLADVEMGAFVEDAGAVWRRRCEDVGVRFSAQVPTSEVLVRADPGRLRQVLDGLAENALRVTPAGEQVVFAVTPSGFEVRDSGPGLTDEDLAQAFDRSVLYERYKGVRQVGTGLGLALVGILVRRMGGTAEAGHAPAGGARFRVTLPAA
jgi:signal transduction histidine kinase